MKQTKKLYLKVMSLVMACLICFQFCSTTGYAKSLKKDWSLCYNPSSPSAEWLTTTPVSVSSSKNYTISFVTKLANKVQVKLNVDNAEENTGHYIFTTADAENGHIVTVTKGLVYVYKFSYYEYSKYANRVEGYVKYFD